ncbi:hypothetical protein MCOR25_009666 [Pyricularia grisea]|nr:hypothetical protein MCOR25_009666 [Pyricularia grisea]
MVSCLGQHSAGAADPQPSQIPESSISHKAYVGSTRDHVTQQVTGSGSPGALSTAVPTAKPTTNKTPYPAALTSNPLSVIPQKRQATDVPRLNTQGLIAHHTAQPIPDQPASYGETGGPRLADANRHQDSARDVTQKAPGVAGPVAVNTSTLAQQTPRLTGQYTWQPPTPATQYEKSYPTDAAQPAVKRKRGRPPKDRSVQSGPPMQVWVGDVPIENYSDEQLAVGISVFTAELNRRRFGTPYPAHFNPKRTIFTPAMPVTTPRVSATPQNPQVYPQGRSQVTATGSSPAVSAYGPYQTNLSGPSPRSGAQPQTSLGNTVGTSTSHSKAMISPSTTSQLISPPPSSGPRQLPLPLGSAQTSQATGFAHSTSPLRRETTVSISTESGSVADGSTQGEHETAGALKNTLAGASGPATTPWGQFSRSPSEAAPVSPSDDSAVFIKNEPGTGIRLAERPASIATAALSLATDLARTEEGGARDYRRQSSPRVKIERD